MQRLAIAFLFAIPAATAAGAGDQVPQRKPGLWEITTVAQGMNMTTFKTCIGPDDRIATPAESGDCSDPVVRRTDTDLFVDVVCKRPYGTQTMSTAFSGDFKTRYHAIMKITYDPPEGVANVGVVIDGKYLAAECGETGKDGTQG